jgi:hypothetical protein
VRSQLTHYLGALRTHGKSIGSGIIGQGLSFAAMVLPILFGRIDEVAFLVTVGAVAGVASYTFTWSYASVYPGIVEERQAAVATVTSAGLLVLASALMLILGVIPTVLWQGLQRNMVWAAALTLPLGLNLMITGLFIRNRDYPAIARLRLVSGGTNFPFILVACLLDTHYLPLLVIPTALSSMLTAAWGLYRNRSELRIQIGYTTRLVHVWQHLRSNLSAAMAALLGGAAFQLVGVATPLMGTAANGWAVAVRLAGGFGTVSQQVLAPMFETDFAHALRRAELTKAAAYQRRAYFLGLVYSAVCAFGVCVIVVLVNADKAVADIDRIVLLVSIAIFSFSILSTSLLPRNLVIAGGQRRFFQWAAIKLVFGLTLLATLRGLPLLVGLTTLEMLFQFAYYAVAARHLVQLSRTKEYLT